MPVSVGSANALQFGMQDDLERQKKMMEAEAAQKYASAEQDLQALLGDVSAEKQKGQVSKAADAVIDMSDPNWRQKYAEKMAAMGNQEVAADYFRNSGNTNFESGGNIGLTDYASYDRAQQSKAAADAYKQKIQTAGGIAEEVQKNLGAGSLEALLMGEQAQAGNPMAQSDAGASLNVGWDNAKSQLEGLEKQQTAYGNIQQAKAMAKGQQDAMAAEADKKKRYLEYLDSIGADIYTGQHAQLDPLRQSMGVNWNDDLATEYRNKMAAARGTMPNNYLPGLPGMAKRKPMTIDEQIAQAQAEMERNRGSASQASKKSYSWDDYGSWGG